MQPIWVKQLQSIAQVGLTYSKDIYDLESLELIRKISVERFVWKRNWLCNSKGGY